MFVFGQPNIEKLKSKGNINTLIHTLLYEKDWRILPI